MTGMTSTEQVVHALRHIAEAIGRQHISVRFPAPDGPFADTEPFADQACEAITHGGTAEPGSLAALLYYIVDTMEAL